MPDRPRPWTLLSSRLAYDASPWLSHHVDVMQLPDGRVIDDFHRVDMRDFAIIAPFTHEGLLVTARAYRSGVRAVCRILPAGYLEAGEAPLDAAQRELREETGYGGGDWQSLGSYAVDGNRGCGHQHAFIARDVELQAAQQLDETEEIEVVLLTRDAAVEALWAGEFGTLPGASTLALALLCQSEAGLRTDKR